MDAGMVHSIASSTEVENGPKLNVNFPGENMSSDNYRPGKKVGSLPRRRRLLCRELNSSEEPLVRASLKKKATANQMYEG